MSIPFPHPLYAKHVLGPGFSFAQAELWPWMLAANEAHALMLADRGIIPGSEVAALLDAQAAVASEGRDAFVYDPKVEDLFFLVERRLIELAGPVAGGNLQIARSRNDLAATMARLLIRDRLLGIEELVITLRERVIALAEQFIDVVIPGITHTQPAQPTTLAHYLLGVLGPLERDSERLAQARARVNRSPLGAAAFTTTGFPIDRELTAELLGFDGIVENGYDAVGAGDHFLESSQVVATLSASLGRFVNDLLIWARQEAGVFRVGTEFVQISSIMPQKRNPVVLEHIRTRIGWVYGHANAIATLVHGAAFGDTNDVDDPIFVPTAGLFEAATAVLELLEATLASGEFNTARLTATAGDGFTTATALADGLVISFGLPFRTAHHIVSTSVSIATREGAASLTLPIVREAIERVTESELEIDQAWLDAQLDPAAFVAARKTRGGPARSAMEHALADARRKTNEDAAEIERAKERIATAAANRRTRLAALPR
ncbi:MAG: argininosuccinate lyase [Thermomicrobiales bacterium]